MDDIAAILAIARHTSSGLDVEKEGWETLSAVLHLSSPKPDELARLPLSEGVPYLRLFPKTQVAYALLMLTMWTPERPSYWSWDLRRELPFRVFLAPDELLWIQQYLKDYREFLATPEQQSFADWHELTQSLQDQQGGWWYLLYMTPRLDGMARGACNVTTLRRLARLAVALSAYRAKHGDYPKTLEELTPAFLDRLPRDPWDGGPLHMKSTEAGVELYTLRNSGDKPVLSPDTAAQRRNIIFRLPGIHE